MIEYKLTNYEITKDGHRMFLGDVVKDLNRRAYLEVENEKLKKKCAELTLKHKPEVKESDDE